MEQFILAFDIGGTSVKCAIAKYDTGEIIHKYKTNVGYKETVLPEIKRLVKIELEKLSIDYSTQIKCIGIASKGAYDKKRRLILVAAEIGWFNYPVMDDIEKTFAGIPVFLTNDSRGACIGEWKRGLGRKYKSFLVLTLGQGIGSGIVLNNKLWVGHKNIAGEIGHGAYFQDQYRCSCGLDGCIEAISGASGISSLLMDQAAKNPQSKLGVLYKDLQRKDLPLNIEVVSKLIYQKDLLVLETLKNALKPLAARISLIQFLFNLEAILIGGGPSVLGDILLDCINFWRKQWEWPSIYDSLDLKVCELKNDAGVIGAIEFAKGKINKTLEEIPE